MEFSNVFVTVGTTKFDKLIATITQHACLKALERRGCKKLVLQIGAGQEPIIPVTNLKVSWYRFKPSLTEDISQANLVIAHAGAGTCLDVLSLKKPLLVVTNEDLMDGHQDELASKFCSLNYLAYTKPLKLVECITYLDINSLEPYKSGNPTLFASFINSVIGV